MRNNINTILIVSFLLLSCNDNSKNKKDMPHLSINWIWIHTKKDKTVAEWNNDFKKYKEDNILGILIGADKYVLDKVIPIAHKYGIKVHAWMWTLNRYGDEEAKKHPEWYSVNRLGMSCFDKHPYVDYYQWVCPSIPEVQKHIIFQVKELLKIKNLDGIHLDYVRYSDAILPRGLWDKYNLTQDKVYPKWDYGYNKSNIDIFEKEYGYSPLDLENPNFDKNWVSFRLNTVTELVNKIADVVHGKGKKLTAAVFPSPRMAREMVYQAWDEWNLDAAMPMIYHNFYERDINWIGEATKECVSSTGGKFPIYTGLFVPNLKDNSLRKAINISKEAGANGIVLFDANSFEKEYKSKIH